MLTHGLATPIFIKLAVPSTPWDILTRDPSLRCRCIHSTNASSSKVWDSPSLLQRALTARPGPIHGSSDRPRRPPRGRLTRCFCAKYERGGTRVGPLIHRRGETHVAQRRPSDTFRPITGQTTASPAAGRSAKISSAENSGSRLKKLVQIPKGRAHQHVGILPSNISSPQQTRQRGRAHVRPARAFAHGYYSSE